MMMSRPFNDSDPVSDSTNSHSAADAPPHSERAADEGLAVRNESAGKLPAEAQLYRLLVQTVRDYAIFALDSEGRVATWNAGAERFKGYTPEEIIGKHFRVFYPPEDIAAGKPERELEEAIRVGRVEDEGWRIRKDGTRFWASVVITALRDASGTLVGFAKVTRDLSERRAAEQRRLDDARRVAAAELANLTKSEFLAAMSHELRTPLNAIGGYADLLALGIKGSLSSQQAEYVQRIRRSQQHLLGIINDLLNYTRIEAGQVTYDLGLVALSGIVANVIPMIEPQAESRGVEVRAETKEGLLALADSSKVEQIVLNLLSNAVKFTPRGGRVTVELRREGDRAGLRVSDTGIGIPAEKLQSIFEPFVQVGRSLNSPHEGTGLGLAISRDLARAMNGDLTVKSELGVGSAFDLTLPAAHEG
jgi:PAS domain S-box-containing protein